MALEFVKLVKGKDVISQIGSLGFFKLGAESGGADIEFSRTFSENSPAIISQIGDEISAKGMTSSQVEETYGWKIGDTKDITLTTGEVIQMRIIGFNHDTLSSGTGTAGITLQMVDCLKDKYPINTTSTVSGGYSASVIRNTTMPTIKSTLPQEWQNIIKTVSKKSANGTSGSAIASNEDLFLLSEKELFGTITYARDGDNEGVVYEYWNNKPNSDRIKYSNGNATIWWERSVCKSIANTFCGVTLNGSADWYGVTTSFGISFAFCVGDGANASGGDDTVVEEVANETGTTLNITSTNYTETLNEQNGYTLEIGG